MKPCPSFAMMVSINSECSEIVKYFAMSSYHLGHIDFKESRKEGINGDKWPLKRGGLGLGLGLVRARFRHLL